MAAPFSSTFKSSPTPGFERGKQTARLGRQEPEVYNPAHSKDGIAIANVALRDICDDQTRQDLQVRMDQREWKQFGVVHQDAVLLSDLAYNNIKYSRSSATEEQVKLATDLRQHRRGFPALLDVEPGERGPKIVWRRQAVCVDPTYHLDEILQCPLDGPPSALARLEQRWRG
ncbi:MAG: hypothetical protein J3Q66DRAFT_423647 [Benniella sp.]|nr:MAG: hypothetical protein J3Q66DRAFT_423647 [Benniella sp.]